MYKLIIADSDTPLFRAAKSVQEDFITVTLPDGRVMEFKNKTELWGHHAKKENGWLAGENAGRWNKGLMLWQPEDLNVEEGCRLSPDIDNHLEEAEKQFDFFVGKLKKTGLAHDYVLVLGGEGNFRYDVATLQPYKGQRKAKPLLFQELKELIGQKYSKKIRWANDEEADDVLGILGYENYLRFRETGIWDNILAYIDKDIDMVMSPSWNFNDDIKELPLKVRIPTEFECARCFAVQLLCGDKATDNIPGLPNITEELRLKYKLRRAVKGIGKATAQDYLRTCNNTKELFERVTEAYKAHYGRYADVLLEDCSGAAVGYDGEMLFYNYIDYMQENGILLWMRRYEGEMFNMREFLTKHKISFTEGEADVKAIKC